MGTPENPKSTLQVGVRVHLIVFALGAVVLICTAALARAVGVEGSFLTREPQVVLKGPLYAGILSNLGAVVWTVGATLAFVGAAITSSQVERKMFIFAGLVGTVLLFDDFFLFHDWVGHRSRILEQAMMVSYMLAVLGLAFFFREPLGLLATGGVLVTLGLLGASAGLDFLLNGLDQIVEDGFKFLGICTWSTTWLLRARLHEVVMRA